MGKREETIDAMVADSVQGSSMDEAQANVYHFVMMLFLSMLSRTDDLSDLTPTGEYSVTATLNARIPEDTPPDFEPANELELIMSLIPGSFLFKITQPYSCTRQVILQRLSENKRSLERSLNCELVAYETPTVSSAAPGNVICIDFMSKRLRRSMLLTLKM